ncbi:MAG TPA: RNA polymerase sigma factor [bacterium]|nr:RNA polymerase sigma factor [bacterium]HPS28634.1 RNA polymerase sigma factor [bacterium]
MIKRFLGRTNETSKLNEINDNELAGLALSGSREAWKELVKRYYRMISVTVFRITGGRDSEDVIQEVLIQLFKSLGSFRGESAFSTFLYRLALNTACREVKKMTNLSSIVAIGTEIVEKMVDSSGENDDSFNIIEKEEMERLIQMSLEKIPADLRMYLVLSVVEGLTLKEISEMFKTPITTIASRISKAKVLMLKEMEKLK